MTSFEPPAGEGYDLQAVYAENSKPFYFRWADRWWMLPHLKNLDFEVQAKVETFDFSMLTGTNVDLDTARNRIDDLFNLVMGDEQGTEWRAVNPRPVNMLLDMLQSWTKHSGVKEGEASASEGSSRSTGRPSKRTSKGSTASASRRRSPAKAAPEAAVTPPENS